MGKIDETKSGKISIRNVTKVYDPDGANVMALDDFSLEIDSGDFIAVVGPSGCGKSTLLNILAGFDTLTEGQIVLDGENLASIETIPKPGNDRVVVFQQGALFPWKTVMENITYGLIKSGSTDLDEIEARAREFFGNLEEIANVYPAQLSSGMQRRVEIIRAIINDPKLLLLDEPF